VTALGALRALPPFCAALQHIDDGLEVHPDGRLEHLVITDAATRNYQLPRAWRQLVRIAARLTNLPHRGALAEPGSLPDPYPYELCVRRRAPARVLAVLYELFTSSDYLGTGTTRAVFSDGPDHVLKVPLGA
jgi:hypothetical protein